MFASFPVVIHDISILDIIETSIANLRPIPAMVAGPFSIMIITEQLAIELTVKCN